MNALYAKWNLAHPCILRMSAEAVNCDDSDNISGTLGGQGGLVLLELGIFGVRKDPESVGTALALATMELYKDGIQDCGGQHHGQGSPTHLVHSCHLDSISLSMVSVTDCSYLEKIGFIAILDAISSMVQLKLVRLNT